MARGKKLASYSCTQCNERNLTKHSWNNHKEAHELERLTAEVTSKATQRKKPRSNEDLPSYSQGEGSHVDLLTSDQHAVVINESASGENNFDSDFECNDNDFGDDYDNLETEQSESDQEDKEEKNSEYLESEIMYNLIKSRTEGALQPLNVVIQRPSLCLTNQEDKSLRFHQLLEDNGVNKSATEKIIDFLNNEMYIGRQGKRHVHKFAFWF